MQNEPMLMKGNSSGSTSLAIAPRFKSPVLLVESGSHCKLTKSDVCPVEKREGERHI